MSSTNGNGHVLKWLLGLCSVVVAGLAVAFNVWLVKSVVETDKRAALLELRVVQLEKLLHVKAAP